MRLKKRVLAKGVPHHIAIILDGNGRWAKKRNLPRTMGHRKGAENLRDIAISCKQIGVKALSVYAFSTENWNRPKDEIDYLMKLPKEFEERYKGNFKEHDIKVIFSGRKDRFSTVNRALLEKIEEKTKDRTGLTLNVCFDYGSQYEMLEATKAIANDVSTGKLDVSDITKDVFEEHLYTKDLPQLDLLIRTSGEVRLSNFLLWQAAYAEFYFTNVYWPDFNEKQLLKAIDNFQKRNRRYGGIKE